MSLIVPLRKLPSEVSTPALPSTTRKKVPPAYPRMTTRTPTEVKLSGVLSSGSWRWGIWTSFPTSLLRVTWTLWSTFTTLSAWTNRTELDLPSSSTSTPRPTLTSPTRSSPKRIRFPTCTWRMSRLLTMLRVVRFIG